MCTSPLIVGFTDGNPIHLPDALRVIADDNPWPLIRELERQARVEDLGLGETRVVDGTYTPEDYVPRLCTELGDDSLPSRLVVVDMRNRLSPPVGPASGEVLRMAFTRGHTLLIPVPSEAPFIGRAILPPEAPFLALPGTAAYREAVVTALVARDRADEALSLWTERPTDALFVSADGVLAQPITTSIPAEQLKEQTA